MTNDTTNPLISRQRRARDYRLSLALGATAAIVLLFCAGLRADAASPAPVQAAQATATTAPANAPAASAAAKPARQVRVIPLFNTASGQRS